MSDKPATLDDVFDEVIAEAEAEAKAETLEAPKGVKATDKALLYARDFGVDITKVKGTGAEGKVTVPDVQNYHKEMEAAALEAEAEPEKVEAKPVEEKKPAKKKAKKAASSTADRVAVMPTLRTGLKEVYHVVRSIHEYGFGWDNAQVTGRDADENIGRMLEEGWIIVHIQALGVDMDGIRMLWVLGLPDEGMEEKFWPYREIVHLTRPIGNAGDDGRGITGLNTNEFISGYLRDGWDLALVHALGMGTGVVNMLWVLVR